MFFSIIVWIWDKGPDRGILASCGPGGASMNETMQKQIPKDMLSIQFLFTAALYKTEKE